MPRILFGMTDYYSGIDYESLNVVTDFTVNSKAAGENLADQFRNVGTGIFELVLETPFAAPGEHSISLSVKDGQGNAATIKRTFRIEAQ